MAKTEIVEVVRLVVSEEKEEMANAVSSFCIERWGIYTVFMRNVRGVWKVSIR